MVDAFTVGVVHVHLQVATLGHVELHAEEAVARVGEELHLTHLQGVVQVHRALLLQQFLFLVIEGVGADDHAHLAGHFATQFLAQHLHLDAQLVHFATQLLALLLGQPAEVEHVLFTRCARWRWRWWHGWHAIEQELLHVALAEFAAQALFLALPRDVQLHSGAGFQATDQLGQLIEVPDLLAVDLAHHVTFLQAHLLGRGAFDHLADAHTAFIGTAALHAQKGLGGGRGVAVVAVPVRVLVVELPHEGAFLFTLTQGHVQALHDPLAVEGHAHLIAGLVVLDHGAQGLGGGDGHAIDLHHHIAVLEAGLSGGTPGHDLGEHRGVLHRGLGHVPFFLRLVVVGQVGTEPGHGLAGLLHGLLKGEGHAHVLEQATVLQATDVDHDVLPVVDHVELVQHPELAQGVLQGVLVVQVELVLAVTGLPVLGTGDLDAHLAVAVLGEGSGREGQGGEPGEKQLLVHGRSGLPIKSTGHPFGGAVKEP